MEWAGFLWASGILRTERATLASKISTLLSEELVKRRSDTGEWRKNLVSSEPTTIGFNSDNTFKGVYGAWVLLIVKDTRVELVDSRKACDLLSLLRAKRFNQLVPTIWKIPTKNKSSQREILSNHQSVISNSRQRGRGRFSSPHQSNTYSVSLCQVQVIYPQLASRTYV